MTRIPFEQGAQSDAPALTAKNAIGSPFHDEVYAASKATPAKGAVPTSEQVARTETGAPACEQVMPADVKQLMQRDFKIFDRDGNGRISEAEITQALQDKSLSCEDQQVAAFLKVINEKFHTTGIGFARGVSLDNIEDYDRMQKEVGKAGNDASKLAANPEITREELHQYEQQHSSVWRQINELKPALPADREDVVLATSSAMAGVRREEANNRLYEDEKNPLQSITPEAIKQGAVGDCYFLSAVASLAVTNAGKESIANMIQDNKDGSYTVKFPGAADEPITVKAPTAAEMAIYEEPLGHGTWAAVLEKGYGQYCNQHFWRRSPLPNPLPGETPQKGTDGGSYGHAGLKILTGKDVDEDINILTSYDTMDRKLTAAFKEESPVTAYTGHLIPSELFDKNDVPSGHEYSVLNYDHATRMITLRNPWGYQEPEDASGKPVDGKYDGIFTMSLTEFNKRFEGLAYTK